MTGPVVRPVIASTPRRVAAAIELPPDMSLENLQDQLRRLVQERFGDGPDEWTWVRSTMDGTLVVEKSGKLCRLSWSIENGEAVLGTDEVEVVERTKYEVANGDTPPADDPEDVASVTASRTQLFVAVSGSTDEVSRLNCCVIGTGLGGNYTPEGRRWHVSTDGLESARKTFGGARVHWTAAPSGEFEHFERVHHREPELAEWLGTDHDIGYLSDLRVEDDGLHAVLNLDSDVPEPVLAALREGRVGLSVEAMAEHYPMEVDGVDVVDLRNWRHFEDRPASVAVVSNPALRGEVLSIAASVLLESSTMTLEEAKKIVANPDDYTEEQLATARKVCKDAKEAEGGSDESTSASTAQPVAASTVADQLAQVNAALDQLARATDLETARKTLASSGLPEPRQEAILASFTERQDMVPEFRKTVASGWLQKSIDFEREIEKKLDSGGDARVMGSSPSYVGAESKDRMVLQLEHLIAGDAPPDIRKKYDDRNHGGKTLASRMREAGIPRDDWAFSFRRLFRDVTGYEITDLHSRDRARFKRVAASIESTTFNDAMENVLNRTMLAYYEDPDFSDWRKVVRPVPTTDVRKQESFVKGGYPNLPSVPEGTNYLKATTPNDEGHGWTPVKYGYTEDLTEEAQINDDVAVLRDIPRSMGLAAARTLYENVFDKLTIVGMPTMDYDSTALFTVGRGNYNSSSTALTGPNLIARRLAMRKRADLSTSKRLGLEPALLLVPVDLEDEAYDLLKPKAEEPGGLTDERSFLRRMNLRVVVVRHWTATTTWLLMTDPMKHDCYRWSFYAGRQEPEFYVQDDVRLGTRFSADKIVFKIRQPWNEGSPTRHEHFDLNVG